MRNYLTAQGTVNFLYALDKIKKDFIKAARPLVGAPPTVPPQTWGTHQVTQQVVWDCLEMFRQEVHFFSFFSHSFSLEKKTTKKSCFVNSPLARSSRGTRPVTTAPPRMQYGTALRFPCMCAKFVGLGKLEDLHSIVVPICTRLWSRSVYRTLEQKLQLVEQG